MRATNYHKIAPFTHFHLLRLCVVCYSVRKEFKFLTSKLSEQNRVCILQIFKWS